MFDVECWELPVNGKPRPPTLDSHRSHEPLKRGSSHASVLDCGGKSDATPLCCRTLTRSRVSVAIRKRRRRCALPAQSKPSLPGRPTVQGELQTQTVLPLQRHEQRYMVPFGIGTCQHVE